MFVNWLDLVIGGIFLVSLIGAVRNGATREMIRLIALALGLIGAMWGYQRLADRLAPYISDDRLAAFTAFLTIVFGCLTAGALLAWAMVKLWGWTGLRWFDRLLGAGFGLLRGGVVAAAVVLGLVAFSPVEGIDEAVADSHLAPWVLFGAQAAAELAPDELEASYEAGFERVRAIWTEANPYAVMKN